MLINSGNANKRRHASHASWGVGSRNFCDTMYQWFVKIVVMYTKLMRSNRLWVRFCLKSDSNRHLIDIFNPNSWNLIKSWWQIGSWFNQNILNLAKFNQIWSKMINNPIDFNIFNWFRPILIYLSTFSIFYPIYINLLIKKDKKWSTLIKIRSKLYRNHYRWSDLVVEIQIELKSTIEFGRLGIRIIDDSILVA